MNRRVSNLGALEGTPCGGSFSSETEIKFALKSGYNLARVVEGIGENGCEPDTYEGIYFDTDNFDLKCHRAELSVQNKNGHWVQKIKVRPASGSVLTRQCHEIELSDLQPNPDPARSVLPPPVRAAIAQATLKPRFRTRFSRISYQWANDSSATRTLLDEGHIEADGRSELISEVELKLKGGQLASYSDECLSLLRRAPASLLVEGKASRGYRLASGELPRGVNATHVSISGDVPLPEAILRVFRHSFQHFLDNHPAVTLTGTPESIHQMRVSLRRLRSVIRVFSPVLCLEGANDLIGDIKTLFAKLGEAREADVFLGETLPAISRAGLCATFESVLVREVTTFRDRVYHEIREELMSADIARLVVQLNNWIEGGTWLKANRPIDALLIERSVEDFALPRISSLCSKLLKHGAKARHGTLDDWHRARIAAKKLRYAGEPLFGALATRFDIEGLSKQLSRLQTSLGRLNDLETVTPFLARVRSHIQGRSRRNFEAAECFCNGWACATSATMIGQAENAIESFAKIGLDAF